MCIGRKGTSFKNIAAHSNLEHLYKSIKWRDCISRINGKGGRFESESLPELLEHSIGYFLPLGILDTFHVKHYYGVPDDVIIEKRQNWIQVNFNFMINLINYCIFIYTDNKSIPRSSAKAVGHDHSYRRGFSGFRSPFLPNSLYIA